MAMNGFASMNEISDLFANRSHGGEASVGKGRTWSRERTSKANRHPGRRHRPY